jgi:hypothetical protein
VRSKSFDRIRVVVIIVVVVAIVDCFNKSSLI